MVFRFSCMHLSDASEVMKEMNSETHSCTVSLESLAILAFSGRVFFIMRAMFAMGRYRSCCCCCSVKMSYEMMVHVVSYVLFVKARNRLMDASQRSTHHDRGSINSICRSKLAYESLPVHHCINGHDTVPMHQT